MTLSILQNKYIHGCLGQISKGSCRQNLKGKKFLPVIAVVNFQLGVMARRRLKLASQTRHFMQCQTRASQL
jgi:hypothetical protein